MALGIGGAGCQGDGARSPLEPDRAPTFRTAGWEDFPIVLEGATPGDITGYTIDVGTQTLGLEDLVDVVAYARRFQPCDLGAQPDADLASFDYATATAYIDAAQAKRIHVMTPLPYIGGPAAICDGQLDLVPDPDELWNHDHTVQIPLSKDQITSDFTAYWSAKVGNFIDAVDAYDTGDVVWSWRGLEELRFWVAPEVELARAMRSEVDAHDGTRHLTAYTPNHYMPDSSMIATLLDRPHASLSPYHPLSVTLDPAAPVARSADAGIVSDYYPREVEVNREVTGGLRPMFDHIMTGAYTGLVLGADGHVNRIHPYHRSLLGEEARHNLEAIYAANGQAPPDPILFHAPDLSAGGVVHMSREEAQHDLWAGLHVAEGLYLYNFAYRDVEPDVWDAYARGLHLIKSQMRDVLAHGGRWTPTTWHDGAVQTVPGDDYATRSVAFEDSDHLASAVAPDPEHAVLNATMVAMNGETYLIVTHSWAQAIDFEVTVPACTVAAKVVYGETDDLSLVGTTLSDSLSGIDGRVYQLRVAPC